MSREVGAPVKRRVPAPPPDARGKYRNHKYRAARRGVPFSLTFDEWWDIWERSGRWSRRGNQRDCFVMARIGDRGGYEVGNVRIITVGANSAEAWSNSERHAEISAALKRRWRDPAFRAKISAGRKRTWQNPEYRAEISVARKAQWKNPARR